MIKNALYNKDSINTIKKWLIKINGEDNLYYDSINKEYRLRLFCPRCHKPSGCQCYQSLRTYEEDSISTGFPVRCCSYLCCLIINSDNELENINKAVQNIRIDIRPIEKYTEEEARQIVYYLVDEGIWNFLDESSGDVCRT